MPKDYSVPDVRESVTQMAAWKERERAVDLCRLIEAELIKNDAEWLANSGLDKYVQPSSRLGKEWKLIDQATGCISKGNYAVAFKFALRAQSLASQKLEQLVIARIKRDKGKK